MLGQSRITISYVSIKNYKLDLYCPVPPTEGAEFQGLGKRLVANNDETNPQSRFGGRSRSPYRVRASRLGFAQAPAPHRKRR